MELKRMTKFNISKTTGLPIASLLEEKPITDSRLKKIQRKPSCSNEDMLVRGNPQLTLGRVTPVRVVDAYFDKKKKAGD